MSTHARPIAYPAIERHGLIGDRRTCALIAHDGTLDWWCLPNFDGDPVFGALLDATQGGYWRVGPRRILRGTQHYREQTSTLVTTWSTPDFELELRDVMLMSDMESPAESARIVVRQLVCRRGEVDCVSDFHPREGPIQPHAWSARPGSAHRLRAGETWCLAAGTAALDASPQSLQRQLEGTERVWRDWADAIEAHGSRRPGIIRSAITLQLLSYEEHGAPLASATTSLPERLGGKWNCDYRLSWIRDASLVAGCLSTLSHTEAAARYLEWLHDLDSSTEAPLQVLYQLDGGTRPIERELRDFAGYRGSRPVRVGNHAHAQRQLDAFGFLADCMLTFVERGGKWRREFWDIVKRSADFVTGHWNEPDNSIWELPVRQMYVSSRVMSWVALDRAVKLAEKVGEARERIPLWRDTARQIHAQVLDRGFSKEKGAFVQRYHCDALDAATLLIPLFGFLPVDDPRVASTVAALERELCIDLHLYRFDPLQVPGLDTRQPLGEFEAAFLPCTFWLSTVHAMQGRRAQAEATLAAVERISGSTGLFAEAVDPRAECFMGNMPLAFSHAEYLRLVHALEQPPHAAQGAQRSTL
jgi:GH15 family glucan-1,4-alpha-glucosidase